MQIVRLLKTRWVWIVCVVISLLLAATECIAYRDTIFQDDAISYLDISDDLINGRLWDAINPYWDPLYPLVLAVFRVVLRPDTYWEPAVVKLANFFIFMLVLSAFNFFLTQLLRLYKSTGEQSTHISENLFVVAMYCWFWFTCLAMGTLQIDTPDSLICAAALTASGLILRAQKQPDLKLNYVCLGLVLGTAYFAKPIALPLAFAFFLLCLSLSQTNIRKKIVNTILYGSCFAALAIPHVALLSMKAGHFTVGDNAIYNWAIGVEMSMYDKIRIASDIDKHKYIHPPRIIDKPTYTMEFAEPKIGGTYSLWGTPAYWHAGLGHVPWTTFTYIHLVVLYLYNIYFFLGWFGAPLLVTWLCFRPHDMIRALQETKLLWFPAIVGLACPAATIALGAIGQGRYFPSFVLMIAGAVLLSAKQLASSYPRRGFQQAALAIFCVYPVICVVNEFSVNVIPLLSKPPAYVDYRIAQWLERSGLKPGDQIAFLSMGEKPEVSYQNGFVQRRTVTSSLNWYYWARLAKLRAIAQICNLNGFDSATPEHKEELYAKLRKYGVKAIVYRGDTCKLIDISSPSSPPPETNFDPRDSSPEQSHGQGK